MIYATVKLTITHPDTFAAYATKAGNAMKKHGGTPVAQSQAPEVIEGKGPIPTRAVILSFPDKEAALGWINDPELVEVHALRTSSGESEIILLT